MRDRRLELIDRCRARLNPYDWDFATCPLHERRYLLCYECARELEAIREQVAWIRTGAMPSPSYWRAIPAFGWSEWPQAPYLSVPKAERLRRIAALKRPDDPWIRALPILSPIIGSVRLSVTVNPDALRDDTANAIAALLEAYQIGRIATASTRRASRSQIVSRMHGLSVYRLRKHFSAAETLLLLEATTLEGLFTEQTNLHRAKRKAKRDLLAFALKAQELIGAGQWIFPFGTQLVIK